jgi:hypothetical protein
MADGDSRDQLTIRTDPGVTLDDATGTNQRAWSDLHPRLDDAERSNGRARIDYGISCDHGAWVDTRLRSRLGM